MVIAAAPVMVNASEAPLQWELARLGQATAIGILLVAGPRIQAVFVASVTIIDDLGVALLVRLSKHYR